MEAKQRACLKCNHLFDSAGPGNRICRRCQQINDRQPITETQLQKQRGAKRHNSVPTEPCADD
jgi:phage FluMu protein Com